MSSTLSEGVRVPDIGSVNWGADVNFNWGLLNTALANISGNVKVDAENTWTAPQTFTETISGSIDGVAARAVGDEDGNNIKTALAGKQPSLSQTQLDACNSGITAAAVQQIGTNASNISSLQTAVSGKAADADVVHKAGAETISGDKTFSGAVVTHHITPEADNTYSLGNSSYQWASVYAQAYYYGTTSFTDKFVTVDTEQSISKAKEFTQSNADTLRIKNGRVAIGETISSDVFTQFSFRDKNTDNLAYIRDTYFADGSTTLSFYVRNKYANGAPSTTGSVSYAYWGIGVDATGKPFASVRGDFASYSNATYNLGTSTNKWKTLNGINPGALSLPDISMKVNLDTTTWNLSGGNNAYTPSADGFLSIRSTTATQITIVENTTGYGTSVVSPTSATLIAFLPVTQGMSINIIVNCTSLNQAVFLPAKGNV